jgi:hypothetical protein
LLIEFFVKTQFFNIRAAHRKDRLTFRTWRTLLKPAFAERRAKKLELHCPFQRTDMIPYGIQRSDIGANDAMVKRIMLSFRGIEIRSLNRNESTSLISDTIYHQSRNSAGIPRPYADREPCWLCAAAMCTPKESIVMQLRWICLQDQKHLAI